MPNELPRELTDPRPGDDFSLVIPDLGDENADWLRTMAKRRVAEEAARRKASEDPPSDTTVPPDPEKP